MLLITVSKLSIQPAVPSESRGVSLYRQQWRCKCLIQKLNERKICHELIACFFFFFWRCSEKVSYWLALDRIRKLRCADWPIREAHLCRTFFGDTAKISLVVVSPSTLSLLSLLPSLFFQCFSISHLFISPD